MQILRCRQDHAMQADLCFCSSHATVTFLLNKAHMGFVSSGLASNPASGTRGVHITCVLPYLVNSSNHVADWLFTINIKHSKIITKITEYHSETTIYHSVYINTLLIAVANKKPISFFKSEPRHEISNNLTF